MDYIYSSTFVVIHISSHIYPFPHSYSIFQVDALFLWTHELLFLSYKHVRTNEYKQLRTNECMKGDVGFRTCGPIHRWTLSDVSYERCGGSFLFSTFCLLSQRGHPLRCTNWPVQGWPVVQVVHSNNVCHRKWTSRRVPALPPEKKKQPKNTKAATTKTKKTPNKCGSFV